jgi:hypothetical protein
MFRPRLQSTGWFLKPAKSAPYNGNAFSVVARPFVARALNLLIYMLYFKAASSFYKELGYLPNVALPDTYNEKMFWRRVFDHDPRFVAYCDKIETKKLFLAHAPAIDVAQTLWSGSDPAEMPPSLMGADTVVKSSSGSRANWFFSERPAEREAFLATCRKWLSRPYGVKHGEWAYTKTRRMLLAERTVISDRTKLEDLKVHLFGGEVFYTLIYLGEKMPGCRSAIFDEHGKRLTVTNSVVAKNPAKAAAASYRVPDCYPVAMDIARKLARDSDYLRVDFMVADGKLYGGEITVYPTAGLMTNSEPDVLRKMGEAWDLRRSWFLSTDHTGWRALYKRFLKRETEAKAPLSARHETVVPYIS